MLRSVSRPILAAITVLFVIPVTAQQEKKFIYEGNQQYDKKDYVTAEKQYNKALGKKKDSYKAAFNLGDAYYQQGKYEEAADQFQRLTDRATSKDTLARAYHNLGNCLLKTKKYSECIDAYKNALKNNPTDEDTRYNLCYAQQMLKQQQQQQNKDNKENQKDKEKDKDKDKQKEDKEKKEKEEQEKKEQQKQKPENKISKEDAKRILEALQNDEKDLQDKVKKGKVKGMKQEIEKDW